MGLEGFEPSSMQAQTLVPTYANTPEFCPTLDAMTALDELLRLSGEFHIQTSKAMEKKSRYDYLDIVPEMQKIQKELEVLDVPICILYAKDLFMVSLTNIIEGLTYYTNDKPELGMQKLDTADSLGQLYNDEMMQLMSFVPASMVYSWKLDEIIEQNT